MNHLPILDVLDDVRQALRTTKCCVLEAAPGAGKTTLVPLGLLEEPWLGSGRIVMLEPRRVAARAAARRMAQLHGCALGDVVGYTMRNDRRVTEATQIEVVTEGVLTRRLARDPALDGIACVIFDEFHERSIHADVALALTLATREILRPELRIVVMSATLGALNTLAPMIAGDNAQQCTITCPGRMFPVDTVYLRRPPHKAIHQLVAAAVHDALDAHTGDVLCFLPGMADIKRTQELLRVEESVALIPLHGQLASEAQDAALAPTMPGHRKVILATAIAETSLTFDGVRVVVDAGLSREARFDPRSATSKLVTVSAALDSIEQRRGRAGRVQAGTCYRLWTEAENAHRSSRRAPEITTSDLTSLTLDLAVFGTTADQLSWIDPPPTAMLGQARSLLYSLGALDANGNCTQHGRSMQAFGTSPRIAHMIVAGRALGLDATVLTDVANTIEPDSARLDRVRSVPSIATAPPNAVHMSCAVALAYPDRVARSRGSGRYMLANGRTAKLPDASPLHTSEWLAIYDADSTSGELVVRKAVPLNQNDVEWLYADQIITSTGFGVSESDEAVIARIARKLGAVIVEERDDPSADEHTVAMALAQWIIDREWVDLDWPHAATHLVDRLSFVHFQRSGAQRSNVLQSVLGVDVLAQALLGKRRLRDAALLNVVEVLRGGLSWDELSLIETLAPTTVTLPSARTITIDYSNPAQPTIASKLQHFFGCSTVPSVLGGTVQLTVHLLSPAGRPVQVTQDLAGFWKGSYADVRKDLRGRYPKHHWPAPEEL